MLRAIALADGSLKRPQLLAFMDDASRLICHAQWYLDQTSEAWAHGLSQAMLKRGLPRALLTDNGSAMMAAESTEGLARLDRAPQTLPYTPEQNGKQEVTVRASTSGGD
ncbi:MAG: transposase family protein [Myxococcales bacterium]|nr:transposase family protein [Myxococcales bacterium]